MVAITQPAATLKRCRGCQATKEISEFGINSANVSAGARDGLNIRCKVCIRQSIAASRQRLREYKAAHPQSVTGEVTIQPGITSRQLARRLRRLKPHDKVREAIRYGAETQDEIQRATRLQKDDICESLAQLILWDRTIRSEVIGSKRFYFINELGSAVRRQPVKHEPRSHGVSTIYFAA